MGIIARVAQRFGVVRASRYVAVVAERHKADARAASLLAEVEKLRAAVRAWKDKTGVLSQALEEARAHGRRVDVEAARARSDALKAEREARRAQRVTVHAQRDTVRAQRDAARRIEQLEKAVSRAEELNVRFRGDLTPLAQRLADAERDLAVARENLMAIETKLDILEGAATVLDRRTRADALRETGPGAPA